MKEGILNNLKKGSFMFIENRELDQLINLDNITKIEKNYLSINFYRDGIVVAQWDYDNTEFLDMGFKTLMAHLLIEVQM